MRFAPVAAVIGVSAVVLTGCSNKAEEPTTAVPSNFTMSAAPQEFKDDTRGVVKEVKDANTVVLTIDGEDREVRMANVLTPNKRNVDYSGSCLIDEAKAYTEKTLPAGTEVSLKFDPNAVGSSGYVEAAIYKGKDFINKNIVGEGLGVATFISYGDKFYTEVSDAQKVAADEGKGLYSKETDCSIPHMIQEHTDKVKGAGKLSEEEATEVYRDASEFYNDLQRSTQSPASWEGSFATLTPVSDQLQELMDALGGNYYDPTGVKKSDKESASGKPVRPGESWSEQPNDADATVPAEDASSTETASAEDAGVDGLERSVDGEGSGS